jgi:hypothetical protein
MVKARPLTMLPGLSPRPPCRQEPDLRLALKARPELQTQFPAAVRAALALAQEYDGMRHTPDAHTSRVYVLAEYRRHLQDLGLSPSGRSSGDGGAAELAALLAGGPDRVPDPSGADGTVG